MLDRYEILCQECLDLKRQADSGKEIPKHRFSKLIRELNSLKSELKEASGQMSEEQEERFALIRDRFLEAQNPKPQDLMMIVSVSGRNAAGIDMAMAAREMGLKTICVTSLDYSNNVTSRHSSGKLLKDVCDVVLDICGVKGDSVLYDERVSEKFCSPSTVVAMTLLTGIVGETITLLANEGIDPPIWVSGNLDRGDRINAEHIRKYKGRVAIL